jgi:hypothetical protein
MIIAPFLLIPTLCSARVEEVYVHHIRNDNAEVIRRNGETYTLQTGVGCLSLTSYEGKRVYIVSPGTFLGVGSQLILPSSNQDCRIWNSEYIGFSSPTRGGSPSCQTGMWVDTEQV